MHGQKYIKLCTIVVQCLSQGRNSWNCHILNALSKVVCIPHGLNILNEFLVKMFLVSDGEQATSITFMKRRIHKCNERSRIQSLTIPLKIWGSGGEKKFFCSVSVSSIQRRRKLISSIRVDNTVISGSDKSNWGRHRNPNVTKFYMNCTYNKLQLSSFCREERLTRDLC